MYLAAIVHDEDSSTAQKVLDGCIGRLKTQGVCVQGLNNAVYVQEDGRTDKCVVSLDGLHTYLIFQDLGTESQSCRLNPAVLAEAATVLHEVRSNRPDLVIINRFGVVEARGEGLVQEFADLFSDGLPVLTLLNRKYLQQWQEFTGGMAEILPAEEAAVNNWLHRIGVTAGGCGKHCVNR